MSSKLSKFPNPAADFTLYPLLWLSCFFAIGIFFAKYVSSEWKIHLLAVFFAGVLTALFIGKKFAVFFLFAAFFFAGSFLYGFHEKNRSADSLKKFYESGRITSGDPVEIEGTLGAGPETAVAAFFLTIDAEKIFYKGKELKASGRVRLFAPVRDASVEAEYEALKLRRNLRIRATVNLEREEKFLNPGAVPLADTLDQKNIDATGVLKSPLLIESLPDDGSFSPAASIEDYRQTLIETVSRKFSAAAAGILIASTLGNKNYLTRETSEIFRDGGTFHVLVISGLHVTFIGGILLFLARRLTRRRTVQFFATVSVLWIYSFAVGAEIPVVRAALMFTVLLFSLVIYRQGTLLNAFGASFILILVWRPEDLFSQSFHLTFASVFAIIAAAFPLIEKLRQIGEWTPSAENPFPPRVSGYLKTFCETIYWNEDKWRKILRENVWDCRIFKASAGTRLRKFSMQKPLRWIFEGMLVTSIVQIFLLPFLVMYFHRLSVSSIVLNLWVGFFMVLQNAAVFVTMIFAWVGGEILALPFVEITEIFTRLMLSVPRAFGEFGWASVRVPVYPGDLKIIYFLYFLPLPVLIYLLSGWNPFYFKKEFESEIAAPSSETFLSARKFRLLAFGVFSILFFAVVFHPFSAPAPDGKLSVDFLDVGQGDAAFVRFPNGATMLIDGGGATRFGESFIEREDGTRELFEPDLGSIGERVVSEFLWEKGFSEIDYLVATHADADHIQGLKNAAENFKVKAAFIGRLSEKKDFKDFEKALRRRGVEIQRIARGDFLEIGGVKIEVLHPAPGEFAEKSENNESVVLRLTFGSRKFLLTGDIEREAEADLLRSSSEAFLRADVVKVAHHGSRTSSTEEFIRATRALYAIIPVGRKSRFGHPHPEVVERWRKSGAKVLTTGRRGTVTAVTDGKSLEIKTFVK